MHLTHQIFKLYNSCRFIQIYKPGPVEKEQTHLHEQKT